MASETPDKRDRDLAIPPARVRTDHARARRGIEAADMRAMAQARSRIAAISRESTALLAKVGKASVWEESARRLGTRAARGRGWLRRNSFSPAWLPRQWRNPRMGYVVGTVSQCLAFVLVLVITTAIPSFSFRGSVPILALVVVALTFGAGPSLWSAVVGAVLSFLLLDSIHAPHPNEVIAAKVVGSFVYLLVGVAISIIASRIERARRHATEALVLAREAQAASERTAAALALERSRTNAMLASIPDYLVMYDVAGNVLTENRGLLLPTLRQAGDTTISGAATAYGLRSSDDHLLAPEDLPAARVLRGEPAVTNYEVGTRLLDGTEHTFLLSAAPIQTEAGGLLGAVTVARDVTNLRAAEHAAVIEDASLRATFEAMTDGVLLYDLDMHIVRSNNAVNNMFGYHLIPNFAHLPIEDRARSVIVRDREGTILPFEELPQVRALHGEMLTGANAIDLRIHTLYGTEIAVNAQATPLRDASGSIIGSVCVFRDVTNRIKMEDRLHRTLDALLEMVAAIADSPVGGDPKRAERLLARRIAALTCSVLGCSRVSISALGMDAPVMLPIAVYGLPPEEEQQWHDQSEAQPPLLTLLLHHEQMRRFLAGEAVTLDLTAMLAQMEDGNRYNISTMMLAPLRTGTRVTGVLALDYAGERHTFSPEELRLAVAVGRLGAVVLERERLRRAQEREEAKARALAEANKLMDEFLGIASHELRTPVTSAKMNVQLATRQVSRLRQAVEDHQTLNGVNIERLNGLLERADQQMDRQTRLVEDLLDVSRIQAGKLELRPRPIDLTAVVRDAVEEQRLAVVERVIRMRVPDAPVMVDADPDRVAQVVTNYLTNALKYSPEDAPVLVTLTHHGGVARVAVADHGPGLPPEEQDRVWERFHRVQGIESTLGSRIGLGLGLFICRTIIEQHGGGVGIESAPGEGSTFWFTLPIADAPSRPAAPE